MARSPFYFFTASEQVSQYIIEPFGKRINVSPVKLVAHPVGLSLPRGFSNGTG